MDQQTLDHTRRGLHGIAELVLAGPQYALNRDIRLRVTPRGFSTWTAPDVGVEVEGLVGPHGRLPLDGSCADLARSAGLKARNLRDVYAVGPDMHPDDPIQIEPEAADIIINAFVLGDAAMREFAPGSEPVLWPEHFDVGITVDDVNYGVSPGDRHSPVPYAYVGPHAQLSGDFWNTSFGAARPLSDFQDVEALVSFFEDGAEHARSDPAHTPDATS